MAYKGQINSIIKLLQDGNTISSCNLTKLNGTTINTGGGVVDAGTMTVVLADDDPAVALLTTIDADTGDILVDTTSIDGKTPALGTAVMAASSPVTIATDDTILLPQYATLNVAHDAVDAGNGFKGAGYAVTTQRAAVAAGDRVDQVLSLNGETISRSHDYTLASEKMVEQAPIWAHRTTVTFTQAGADGVTYFMVIPMDTYKSGSIQLDVYSNNAADVATIKAYITNDPAVTLAVTTATILSDKWVDSSVDILGGASVVTPGGATTNSRYMYYLDTNVIAEYICISFLCAVTTTLTLNAFAKLTY